MAQHNPFVSTMVPSPMAWKMRICSRMTQRRKAFDTVGLVAQLAGLAVVISLFFPAVRRTLAEPGFKTWCAALLIIVCLIGCGIYRLATRERRMKAMSGNPFAASTGDLDQTWSVGKSEGIPDFLYPMLRRRYPWRH